MSALEDERTKRQQAEQQLQQFYQTMTQQQAMRQAVAPQTTSQVDPVTQYIKEQGIGADGFVTPEDMAKVLAHQASVTRQEFTRKLHEQQFAQQTSDFNELVGVQGPMGFQPAPALQRAIQEDPGLQQRIAQTAQSDPMAARALAYTTAKFAKTIIDMEAKLAATPGADDIAKDVAAKTAPMSAAAGAAGGAFNASRAVGDLSDEEFARLDRLAASS